MTATNESLWPLRHPQELPVPQDCACGLLLRERRILLGLRSPHRQQRAGLWDLIGGHVEPGESVAEALLRELAEELDIRATAYSYRTTLRERDPARNGARNYHIFMVTAWSGAGPRLCGDEHQALAWYRLDQALNLDLALPDYPDLFRETFRPPLYAHAALGRPS